MDGAHKSRGDNFGGAQRRKRNPYRKFVLGRGLAEGGTKPVVNELGAISFTLRARGDRTAT